MTPAGKRYAVRHEDISADAAVTCPPKAKLVKKAIGDARRVLWGEYRDVFEHKGPIGANPVLADRRRSMHFCVSWGVGRTIRKGTHDRLRCWFQNSPEFAEVIQNGTGQGLGELETVLRADFGARGGSSLVSVVSKFAAFLRPERFVTWDRYARKGLNLVLGRPAGAAYEDYPTYLLDIGTAAHPGDVRVRAARRRIR